MNDPAVKSGGGASSSLSSSASASIEHAAETAPTWIAPTYVFTSRPRTRSAVVLPHFSRSVDGTGSRRGSGSGTTSKEPNFFRSARWCMDASAVLTTAEDQVVRVYQTPFDPDPTTSSLPTPTHIPLPSPALSSAWFPSASVLTPETCCFALGLRDTPVRLVDGLTGHIRATYPIVDHRERFIAPWSMAWNPTSTKLYCGHENAIEVLDIASPGYDTSERIKTSRTRGDRAGQRGIISALAFSTDFSGLYAAGSFSGSVSLYEEDASGAVGHLDGIVGGGVTQIAFHPLSPHHLFVASRRSSLIQSYDLRAPTQAFHTFNRDSQAADRDSDGNAAHIATLNQTRPRAESSRTNQRLAFDLDPWGRYLAAGDAVGGVRIWGIGQEWGEEVWSGQVGNDAVSSVQFHPTAPRLLVAVGSRTGGLHEAQVCEDSDSDSDSGDEGGDDDEDDDDDDRGSGADANPPRRIGSHSSAGGESGHGRGPGEVLGQGGMRIVDFA